LRAGAIRQWLNLATLMGGTIRQQIFICLNFPIFVVTEFDRFQIVLYLAIIFSLSDIRRFWSNTQFINIHKKVQKNVKISFIKKQYGCFIVAIIIIYDNL
jgi:hypothetical protein